MSEYLIFSCLHFLEIVESLGFEDLDLILGLKGRVRGLYVLVPLLAWVSPLVTSCAILTYCSYELLPTCAMLSVFSQTMS